VFAGATGQQLSPPTGDFPAYAAPYLNGVFVAASNDPGITAKITPAAQTVAPGTSVTVTFSWSGSAPVGSQFLATINWGDGTTDTYTGSPAQVGQWVDSHTYSTAGTYYPQAAASWLTSSMQRLSGSISGVVTVASSVPPSLVPDDGTCDCSNGGDLVGE